MAKISAKNAVITITDSGSVVRTISSDCDSFDIVQDAGALEVTGFGDGSKNYIPGLPVNTVTLDVIYNAATLTGSWTVFKSIFGQATPATLTIKPDPTGQTLTFPCMLTNLPLKGTPHGRLEIGSLKFEAMGSTGASWA